MDSKVRFCTDRTRTKETCVPIGGRLKLSKRISKGLALLLSLALVLAVFGVAGCAKEDDTDTEGEGEVTEPTSEIQEGGTFAFYINEPAFIDPINGQESEGNQVIQAVFDSLVEFDKLTNELVPAAAESWEANEDASVWTFHLREGAKFHDGSDVTAADFKYAWERICNIENESEIAYHLSAIVGYDEMQAGTATELSGVKALDDYTLEVTLQYPYGDFEQVVGHQTLAPVPQAAVEADPEGFADMPIGNGPFKMAEPWAHDQYIKVVKFDDYYGDPAHIDGVDFKIFKDEDTAWLEFQAGNLDFTTIPAGQIPDILAQYGESDDGYSIEPGKQALTGTELATYYFPINMEDATMKDPLVRQAVSLAINRQAIIDTLFDGIRVPATSIVPPGVPGYNQGAWPYAKYDPETAKAKLEEAGYPGGEGLPTIKIRVNTGSGHEDIIQLMIADLEAIGVKAEMDGAEWAQHLDAMQSGDYMIGRLGWSADYPIADNFLYPLFATDNIGADNMARYSNPEVDAAILAAREISDSAERAAAFGDIDAMIGQDAPAIPIMYYTHGRVASDRVRDGVFGAMNNFNFESVWLAQ